jgi:hypothetical protein
MKVVAKKAGTIAFSTRDASMHERTFTKGERLDIPEAAFTPELFASLEKKAEKKQLAASS